MGIVQKILWSITALCAILAGIWTFYGLTHCEGAPQECSVCAVGLILCIVPYVLAKSVRNFEK